MKFAQSNQIIGKNKRRLQDYFDPQLHNVVTPNQRSLPKYKNVFQKPRGKSNKKDQSKRYSNSKLNPKK